MSEEETQGTEAKPWHWPTATYDEAVEALCPGVTAFASAYEGGLIGFRRRGVPTMVHRVLDHNEFALLRQLPSMAINNHPLQGKRFPAGLEPPSAEGNQWHAKARTPQEAALLAGLLAFYDRDAECWRETSSPLPDSLPSESEAAEAVAYLRHSRWWPARGALPADRLPWRNGVDWFLALNGPTDGVEARWFSWASGIGIHYFATGGTLEARMVQAAQCTRAKPARLPQLWDWNKITIGGDSRAEDLVSSDHELGAPWPIWADELTAKRRLLQQAARLLYDANREAWSDNKKHPVRLPSDSTWPAVANLVSLMTRDIELDLNGDHQQVRAVPQYQLAAYRLWLVVNGFAHLRQCTCCGRWVIAYHRPRRTCDSSCRVANYRKSPGYQVRVTGKRP